MTFFGKGRYRVASPSVRLLVDPAYDSKLDDQALMGEEVEVIAADIEFAQVRVPFSGKTGWLASPRQKLIALGDGHAVPTHRVAIPKAVTFRCADPETETMVTLPMNAQIALGERKTHNKDEFARVLGLSNLEAWIRTSALMPLGSHESDFVAVQERLIGTPYVWGSRDTTLGLDCSRTLGESLRASGQNHCPGDTREQEQSSWLGEGMAFPRRGGLLRGDLVFWKGHVVTMVDQKRCIHATDLMPYHRVLIQDLDEVIRERIFAGKGLPTTVRRFERYQRLKLKSLVA